jgi:choice-of-anchor A domain-containing protein
MPSSFGPRYPRSPRYLRFPRYPRSLGRFARVSLWALPGLLWSCDGAPSASSDADRNADAPPLPSRTTIVVPGGTGGGDVAIHRQRPVDFGAHGTRTQPSAGACPPPASLTAHSLVTFGSFVATASDVEGRVAVGGDAQLVDYSIGALLPRTSAQAEAVAALTVKGRLSFLRGRISGGLAASTSSMAHVPGQDAPFAQVSIEGNDDAAPSLAFEDEAFRLEGVLAALRSQLDEAHVRREGQAAGRHLVRVTFAAPDQAQAQTPTGRPVARVARVDGRALAAAHGIRFEGLAADDFVVVVVSGDDVSVDSAGFDVGELREERILWVLPEAKALRLGGVGFPGSILAPGAHVSFSNGVLRGSLVAGSFVGGGQVNFHPLDPLFPFPCP